MRSALIALKRNMDGRDLLVLIGLALVSVGSWFVYWPAAFLVPGAVLLWYALPSRPPFIEKGRR